MKLDINDLDNSDEKMLQAIESAFGDLSLADVIPQTLKDAFVQAGLQAVRQEEPNPEPPSNKEVLLSSYLEYAMHVILERATERKNFHPVLPLFCNLVTNVKILQQQDFYLSFYLKNFCYMCCLRGYELPL